MSQSNISVTRRDITFDYPALQGQSWPEILIESRIPGPRLCIMAGMHPNEVSSMEAAIRLPDYFAQNLCKGSVVILPVVNMPGLYQHSEFICPVDGKNINFSFPGRADGTFSEALAHALLNDWGKDADVLLDLHGGDLREMVAYFTMTQLTGDSAHDRQLKEFARCFDMDLQVNFQVGQTENAGRATNQSKSGGTFYVMSEGGGNGNLNETAVRYHVNGCKNIAAKLGMTKDTQSPGQRKAVEIEQFVRVESPEKGRFYPDANAAEKVEKGQKIGLLRDIWGRETHQLIAPIDGYIVFQVTHNIVSKGDWVFAVGRKTYG